MTGEELLDEIAQLVGKIQSESMVGTAYEKYESAHLWELGEKVARYRAVEADRNAVLVGLVGKLALMSVRCRPSLLKTAASVAKTWPRQEDYLAAVRGVTYGKLREAMRVLDRDFADQHGIAAEDRRRLVSRLSGMTYAEVLAEVRELRRRYDPGGVDIDLNELSDDIYEAAARLRETVDRQDRESLRDYRAKLPKQYITSARMTMASLSSEQTYASLASRLPKRFGGTEEHPAGSLESLIDRVVKGLSVFSKSSQASREYFRRNMGITLIGELSTLMKAASDDEELGRYLRARKTIEQLRLPAGGSAAP